MKCQLYGVWIDESNLMRARNNHKCTLNSTDDVAANAMRILHNITAQQQLECVVYKLPLFCSSLKSRQTHSIWRKISLSAEWEFGKSNRTQKIAISILNENLNFKLL